MHIEGETIMKTNADPFHPGLKDNCAPECAFTLTDLLAVMVTLAILAAVILPALARSGDNGAQTVCLNNLRQMGTALNMYVSENQDTMPWVNWDQDASPPCPRGWLYAGSPYPPFHPKGPPWSTWRVDKLKTGVYWQYIQNPDAFMCPLDALSVGSGDWEARPNQLSTYIMNGASAYYPPSNAGKAKIYGYRTCKMSQIWSPLCIINWEPNASAAGGAGWFAYNDGSSYPDTWEGMGRLHVTGANLLSVGGNTEMWSFEQYKAEVNHNEKGDSSKGKGLMYWNPITADGHGYDK